MKPYIYRLAAWMAVVSLTFFAACGGDSEERVVPKNNGNTTTNALNVPDSLGGPGFEKLAESLGFETNADYEIYGDKDAKKGGSITLAIQEYPAMLRPVGKESNQLIILNINTMVFETLVGLDTKTLKYVPSLASHWKISEDKTTYQFRIDPRAKWADGSPVTSEDVIATYKLLMDESIEQPALQETYKKFNVPTAISPYIVQVTNKQENWRNFGYFGSSMLIFPAKEISKVDGKGYLTKYQFQMPVGTGPYVLDNEKTKQGELVVMKRNPNYWGEDDRANIGANNFDEVRYLVVMDDKLMEEKFKAGEYDMYIPARAQWWIENLAPEKFDALRQGLVQKIKVYNFNPRGTSGLAFNMREEPFSDIRVREAFGLLFNVDQLIEKLFYREYQRCESYYEGSIYQNPNNPTPTYNPTRAVQLLGEAGWKRQPGAKWMTKNGKIFEVDLDMDQSQVRVYTPLQQDLEKVGIKLNLVTVTPNVRFEHLMQRKFKVALENWGGLIFPNPETSLKSELADKGDNNNIYGFKNKRVDELCALYDKTYDVDQRIKMIREIDSICVATKITAFGWVAPYTLRVAHWDKFGMPKSVLSYAGDYSDALRLWWYEPDKAANVAKGMKDKNFTVPGNSPAVREVDAFGRKKS